MRKGQVFIMGAIIFSALILLTAFSYQQIILTTPGADIQPYFQSSLGTQAEVFNEEISENYTAENLKQGFYSFNSIVSRQAESKDIGYSAFQVLILPEKNETVLINYRDEETEYNYYSGSWNNSSVASDQSVKIEGIETSQTVNISELDVEEKFTAHNPTLLGHIEMKSETETWRNYILR